MTYKEKLRDPRWQRKRLEILNAASWTCEDCRRTGNELHVHHCAYIPSFDPWQYEMDLLMVLCEDCHKRRQEREDAFRVALGRITRFLPMSKLESEVWNLLEQVSLRERQRNCQSFNPEDK